MGGDDAAFFTKDYWDAKYADQDRIWSGRPNVRLLEHAADLPPGVAVDVGCGEGADVVWLAERGWLVTGVDVSSVALDRARAHAGEAGVADRTRWLAADLIGGDELPGGADLVSAHYLHVPEADFTRVYAALAAAVRPGGTLLVVGHHPDDRHSGLRNPELTHLLFTPERVTAVLADGPWAVHLAEVQTREQEHHGHTAVVTDSVVVARRADD